jgi:hypothetical protein
MSTTIKRVALVAVAALGLGVVSVAPSQATINADTVTLSATTAAQTTAETKTATSAVLTVSFLGAQNDSLSVTASLVSGPTGNVALPRLALVETSSAKVNNQDLAAGSVIEPNSPASTQAGASSAVTTAKYAIYLGTDSLTAPTKPGTYVVKLTPATVGTSGAINATAQTLTITVTTAPTLDTVATTATIILNAGETNVATSDDVVTASKSIPTSNPGTTAAATISVALKNAAAASATESFTAVITGPGTLGSGGTWSGTNLAADSRGRALTVKAGDLVTVYPDGNSGVATITISSAAGVVLGTKTVTFYGAVASLTTTVKKAVIGVGVAKADVLAVSAKDAAGVAVSNLTSFGVVSSDTTKISTVYGTAKGSYDNATGLYLIPVTSVAAGSANLVVTTNTSATDTTGVSAAAVSVRVGSVTPASVVVTTDKSSYAPGEKAIINVKLLDKDGLELVSGETYTSIFATGGIAASYTLGNGSADTTGTGVISYADGGKTYAVYMPVTEGDVKFSWTTGSVASTTNAGLATANQAVAGSVTVSVSSVATSAAIDAANEAAQAASDATDAALAAADAADAATTKAQEAVDAVATLSAQVSKLITALKAQITTLTNLVIKIQKKVKA